jgi:hypothetical protein
MRVRAAGGGRRSYHFGLVQEQLGQQLGNAHRRNLTKQNKSSTNKGRKHGGKRRLARAMPRSRSVLTCVLSARLRAARTTRDAAASSQSTVEVQ